MLATLALASALTAPSAEPAPPAPRYYFLLFGQQSVPNYVPRTSHTYATFVRAAPTADGKTAIEQVTISWLPADGPVQPLRVRSVAGKNYSLDETFAIAAKDNARVSMWGPFEIDATRYELAVAQARVLDTGAVRFRSVDSFTRNRAVQNCTHAVAYADPNLQRLRQPVPTGYGEPGTSKLAIKYADSGALLSAETHDWLLPVLGLDKRPVVRRALGETVPRQWR